MRGQRITFLVLAGVLWATQAPVALEDFTITGYVKNFTVAFDQPDVSDQQEISDEPIMGVFNNRVRLQMSAVASDWLLLNLAYDFSPRLQHQSLFDEPPLDIGLDQQSYRGIDINRRLYPGRDEEVRRFAIFQNLDRAYLAINLRRADVYVGRQAIAWGSAHVINPTDVLAPFTFDELDAEERIGVDAIRIRTPVGSMGEIDGGWVFGGDFEYDNSAVFIRSKFHHFRADISFVAVAFRENFLAGLDLTRSIGGAGFWLETGHTFVGAFDNDGRRSQEDYLRASLGFDYSLRDGTYVFVEYHYNQAGADQPDGYPARFSTTAYREGAVYLMGKHYLAPGILYQWTPLITLFGEALANLTDPSVFVMPQVEYNIAENIYLSAGAYVGFGESPEPDTNQAPSANLRLRSEFGAYPDSYFASFRLYF